MKNQQEMRQWARRNAAAEHPLVLSPEEVRGLAEGIFKLLAIIDGFWSVFSGRQLTEEEKYGA